MEKASDRVKMQNTVKLNGRDRVWVSVLLDRSNGARTSYQSHSSIRVHGYSMSKRWSCLDLFGSNLSFNSQTCLFQFKCKYLPVSKVIWKCVLLPGVTNGFLPLYISPLICRSFSPSHYLPHIQSPHHPFYIPLLCLYVCLNVCYTISFPLQWS